MFEFDDNFDGNHEYKKSFFGINNYKTVICKTVFGIL